MSSWTDLYPSTGSWTASDALANQALSVWSRDLFDYALERSFFRSLTGPPGSNMPGILLNDLNRGAGETIKIDIFTELSVAPIGQLLSAWQNESTITPYQESVKLGLVRKAIKHDYPFSQQRTVHDLVALQVEKLKQWWVNYGYDYAVVRHLTGNSYLDSAAGVIGDTEDANAAIYYCGTATSTATITDADVLTAEDVWKLSEAARMGVLGSDSGVMSKFLPVPHAGGNSYILVAQPYAISDVKHSAGNDWEDFQKFANVRGSDNPLFVGTGNLAGQLPTPVGRLHGVLIYDYWQMPTYTDWGAQGNIKGAEAVFLGSEAFVAAFGQIGGGEPELVEERGLYEEHRGLLSRQIMGVKRALFNGDEHGCILVRSAAKPHYTNN